MQVKSLFLRGKYNVQREINGVKTNVLIGSIIDIDQDGAPRALGELTYTVGSLVEQQSIGEFFDENLKNIFDNVYEKNVSIIEKGNVVPKSTFILKIIGLLKLTASELDAIDDYEHDKKALSLKREQTILQGNELEDLKNKIEKDLEEVNASLLKNAQVITALHNAMSERHTIIS